MSREPAAAVASWATGHRPQSGKSGSVKSVRPQSGKSWRPSSGGSRISTSYNLYFKPMPVAGCGALTVERGVEEAQMQRCAHLTALRQIVLNKQRALVEVRRQHERAIGTPFARAQLALRVAAHEEDDTPRFVDIDGVRSRMTAVQSARWQPPRHVRMPAVVSDPASVLGDAAFAASEPSGRLRPKASPKEKAATGEINAPAALGLAALLRKLGGAFGALVAAYQIAMAAHGADGERPGVRIVRSMLPSRKVPQLASNHAASRLSWRRTMPYLRFSWRRTMPHRSSIRSSWRIPTIRRSVRRSLWRTSKLRLLPSPTAALSGWRSAG